MVQELLDLRQKYTKFTTQSFANNADIMRRQKEAFEAFINHDSCVAQFLSLFIDDMLKKGIRDAMDNEIEERLQNVSRQRVLLTH